MGKVLAATAGQPSPRGGVPRDKNPARTARYAQAKQSFARFGVGGLPPRPPTARGKIEISDAERAQLVKAALAQGRVTVCAPGYAVGAEPSVAGVRDGFRGERLL